MAASTDPSKIPTQVYKHVDQQQYVDATSAWMDSELVRLQGVKEGIEKQYHARKSVLLGLKRRDDQVLHELQTQKAEADVALEAQTAEFRRTERQCQEEIRQLQAELKASYDAVKAVLIGHSKERYHLRLDLAEKKDVEEARVSMLAQRERLTQELKDTSKRLRAEYAAFEREQFTKRNAQREAEEARLRQLVLEAKATIDREKVVTLKDAEAASKELAVKVALAQKAVVRLREDFLAVQAEQAQLEMALMEAKLIQQESHPERTEREIARLRQEKEALEEETLATRAKPDTENRRKAGQHASTMKKKRSELAGFRKLNALKRAEMEQLRSLASQVIEQRNAVTTFLSDTITILRKQVAANVDQRGLPFRTSELILCHLTQADGDSLGKAFDPGAPTPDSLTASDQLKLFEVLFAKFHGVRQPRKIELFGS